MSALLRADDFRCHDADLVHVLPGRERDAVRFARSLLEQRDAVGLFIRGPAVTDWGFLKEAEGIRRFEFVDFSRTLTSELLAPIRDARNLRLVGRKLPVDFSGFTSLETLYYHWASQAFGFDRLASLRFAALFGLGAAGNANPLPLPGNLETLKIVDYRHDALAFATHMLRLHELELTQARDVPQLPAWPGLHRVALKNVGRDRFDYGSIPESTVDLCIDACATVSDWGFVAGLPRLERLIVLKTRWEPPFAICCSRPVLRGGEGPTAWARSVLRKLMRLGSCRGVGSIS